MVISNLNRSKNSIKLQIQGKLSVKSNIRPTRLDFISKTKVIDNKSIKRNPRKLLAEVYFNRARSYSSHQLGRLPLLPSEEKKKGVNQEETKQNGGECTFIQNSIGVHYFQIFKRVKKRRRPRKKNIINNFTRSIFHINEVFITSSTFIFRKFKQTNQSFQ